MLLVVWWWFFVCLGFCSARLTEISYTIVSFIEKGFKKKKKTVLKDLSAVGSEFLLTIKKDRKNPCILKTEIPNYRVF